MTDLDTTLTDVALAIECGALAWLSFGRGSLSPNVARWAAVLFAALGIAAALGALWHGVLSSVQTWTGEIVWAGVALSLVLATLAAWLLAIEGPPVALGKRVLRSAGIAYAVLLSLATLTLTDAFLLSSLGAVPALLFLTIQLFRTSSAYGRIGAIGAGLFLFAGGLLSVRFSVWPGVIDPNAQYHLLIMLALPMIYIGLPSLSQSGDKA